MSIKLPANPKKRGKLLVIGASLPLNIANLATALSPVPLTTILGAVTVAELTAMPAPAFAQAVYPTTVTSTTVTSNPTTMTSTTVTSNPTTMTSTTVMTNPTSTSRFTAAQANGSQISTSSAQSTVRVTRTFTETLSDRNEDAVKGNGTLVQPGTEGVPASARSYAPDSRFVAYFPNNVLRPGPEIFTPKYKVYGTAFGGGFSDSSSLQGSFVGGLIGLDAQLAPNVIIGGAVGGSNTRSSSSVFAASSDASGFNASLYAIGTKDSYYAQSVTTFSTFTNQTNRNVAAAGGLPSATEVALFGSSEIRERVEIGRVFTAKDIPSLGAYKIVPFVAFEYANLRVNGHSEINVAGTGAFANLSTQGQTINDLPTFVGARVERTFDVGNGMTLTPIVRLAYVHQFASAPVTTSFAAASGATVFASNVSTLGRNAALVKAGAELGIARNMVVFANFDGLFSGDTSLYGGRAGVRYAF